jgi:cell division protein FtsN
MSDADRGAYTPPTDPPLTFDARQPVRGSRPVPLTLIASAGVLALLVVAIVVFYSSGVRKDGEAPRTVGTQVAEMKVAPPAGSQPTDPAAGLQIYQTEKGREAPAAAPTFAPPPETPQPRAVAPPPAASPTTPVKQEPTALPPAKPASQVAQLKPAQPAPAVQLPPKPAPKPAVAAAPVAALPKAPPVKPPAPKLTVQVAPAPAPKPSEPKPASSGGGSAVVQIGAFSSKDQADQGLADAARIAGGGKGRSIEAIQKGGATLYRTQVTGFDSRASAVTYCDKLKAAGKTCFVK